MSFSAKVVADSISFDGVKLTTMQLCYPRFVHSELLTHRTFSRNASSSRAIPIQKMIDQVLEDPACPIHWGKNQPGMQADEELEPSVKGLVIAEWMNARHSAVKHAERMMELGAHKQIVNRVLEPFQWMQTIVTATEWDNFFKLRRHKDAQPEIKHLADLMFEAFEESKPKELAPGEWHLPYVTDDQSTPLEQLKKWSTARCARVSYLTHDKKQPDPHKDELLHDRLLKDGHFSPFEHIAQPMAGGKWYANFRGWQSYRNALGF